MGPPAWCRARSSFAWSHLLQLGVTNRSDLFERLVVTTRACSSWALPPPRRPAPDAEPQPRGHARAAVDRAVARLAATAAWNRVLLLQQAPRLERPADSRRVTTSGARSRLRCAVSSTCRGLPCRGREIALHPSVLVLPEPLLGTRTCSKSYRVRAATSPQQLNRRRSRWQSTRSSAA